MADEEAAEVEAGMVLEVCFVKVVSCILHLFQPIAHTQFSLRLWLIEGVRSRKGRAVVWIKF